MKLSRDMTQELTEEEFKTTLLNCDTRFKDITDISKITAGCEYIAKTIIDAKEVYILLFKEDTQNFHLPTLDRFIPMNIYKESILSECYRTKQPLLVNDVTKSFLYNNKIDNFLGNKLKDLLVVPIIDDTPQNNVIAIIWITKAENKWDKYSKKDVNYIVRFASFIKQYYQDRQLEIETKNETDVDLECRDAYDALNEQMRKEQEYFSSIIHDVKTPMNAVMGFLELLNLREEDRDKKEYLETALKSAETMVALINDALDISKIATGMMSIEKIEFSVVNELSNVAKLFYNSAKEKSITLIAFYDPNIPDLIYSDYHRIKQIMNNLLSNAIKFTPKGGQIHLELIYNQDVDGLTVSIKDTGIGIAENMQKTIFTPYTQEKDSTSREYGGTGLGLSISQQLSVLLGGKLELESKLDEGSKFFFTIPCHSDEILRLPAGKQRLNTPSILIFNTEKENFIINSTRRYLKEFDVNLKETDNINEIQNSSKDNFDILIISRNNTNTYEKEMQAVLEIGKPVLIVGDGYLHENYHWFVGNVRRINAPLLPHDLYNILLELTNLNESKIKEESLALDIDRVSGKRVLVVDDNSINLKFMREVLKTLDLDITLAQDAKESIGKFEMNQFDIIFMDENMPIMQGNEAISLMRTIETENNAQATVIVGLTGDADKKTKKLLLDSGANETLTKPVHIKEITDTILKYL